VSETAEPRLEPLVTAEETRRAEEAHEGPLEELMERAGSAVAQVVIARFPGRVAVVCGSGLNGGDGRVCARVLRDAGRDVTVVEGFGELGEPDVIVDALLGIGLSETPREDAARMIERINASGKPNHRRRQRNGITPTQRREARQPPSRHLDDRPGEELTRERFGAPR